MLPFLLSAAPALVAKGRPAPVDTATSGFASIARWPYGTTVAVELNAESGALRALPAASQLKLYEFEACPFCRRVRELVTYLDLDVTIVPCAAGSRHRAAVAAAATAQGKDRPTFPYLEDEAAGVSLFESEDIVNHLLRNYGNGAPLPPPSEYFLPSALLTGWIPLLLRPGRGATVDESAVAAAPAQPLTLYSYDGNQFCRLVREALTELDLPYTLVSAGKGSPRRADLVDIAGKSTAPYFVDPNTGASMGESYEICEYLFREYSR